MAWGRVHRLGWVRWDFGWGLWVLGVGLVLTFLWNMNKAHFSQYNSNVER